MLEKVMMTFVFDVNAYENQITPSKEKNENGVSIWESAAHRTLPNHSVSDARMTLLRQLACDQDSPKAVEKKNLVIKHVLGESHLVLHKRPPVHAVYFKWVEDNRVISLKLLVPWDADKFIKG